MTLTELKARATELGLTPDDVRQHGSLAKKATWEKAIAEFKVWKDAVNTHCEQMDIPQWTYPEDEPETVGDIAVTVNQEEIKVNSVHSESNSVHSDSTTKNDELPFDPTHTLIDGEWVLVSEVVNPSLLPNLVKTDERFKCWQDWMLPGEAFNTATDDLVQKLSTSEPIPPIQPEVEMVGWHRWDEKLKVWIQENPEETLKDCYQPESESYRQQLLKRMKPYVGNCIQSEDFEQLKDKPLDEPIAAIYLGLLEESERMLTDALLAV